MGSNSTSSNQTTTTSMPANQQRNVDVLLQGALDFFNSGGREFFPGDVVAGFDPLQTQGQNQIVNFAGGVGSDLVSNAINANNRMLDPSMLNPMNMPGFSSTIDDIFRRSTQNLNENILPGIRGGGTASGQFGGTAQQVGQGLAAGRTAEANRGMLGDVTLGAHGLGLNAMNNAIQNSSGLFQLGMAPGMATAGVGDIRQNQAQNVIQGDVARHEFEQNEPMNMLQFLQQITGGMGQFGGTTTQDSTQTTQGSGINQVLGALMSGASLMNPMASMFGGLANTGIGGLLGGLGGGGGLGGNPLGGANPGGPLNIASLLQGIGGG